jgi:hypothetical protein
MANVGLLAIIGDDLPADALIVPVHYPDDARKQAIASLKRYKASKRK